MGANFQTIARKDCTKEELRKTYFEYIQRLKREYGHNGYNGTLSTCSGLQISDQKFPDRHSAEEYLMDNTQKWGDAIAVKLPDGWLIGGLCAE